MIARSEGQNFRLSARDRIALILLGLIVFLSRLPFLNAGYGLHWDAWGNARIAQQIAATGQYTMIRVPGAPLYEVTIAALSFGGPLLLNSLSAVAGTACVVLFALLARRCGCREWLYAAAALGFCCVFYVSSVTAKDFTVALFFVLLSSLLIAADRPVIAGVALGLAMSCRVTSGAMALPLALWLTAETDRGTAFRKVFRFGAAAGVVALLAFVPAFARYGFSFMTTYQPIYYPSFSVVAARGTIEVFGLVGCLGIAIAIIGATLMRLLGTPGGETSARLTIVCLTAILIYAALYVAFPDQAAYALPAVPFAILLIGKSTPRWLFRFACCAIVVGSFVNWQHARPVPGPIFQDRTARLQTIQNVRNFYSYARTIPGNNVFVVGAFYHGLPLIAPESRNGHFVYLLSKEELVHFRSRGFTIYYLPAIREFEYDVNGIDLAQYGAIDLVAFRNSAPQREEHVDSQPTNTVVVADAK